MPHTTKNKLKLHEALQEIARLQLENTRLHKALSNAKRIRVTSSSKIIAGWGRDWSQGYSNPVLSVSLHEVIQEEQLSA